MLQNLYEKHFSTTLSGISGSTYIVIFYRMQATLMQRNAGRPRIGKEGRTSCNNFLHQRENRKKYLTYVYNVNIVYNWKSLSFMYNILLFHLQPFDICSDDVIIDNSESTSSKRAQENSLIELLQCEKKKCEKQLQQLQKENDDNAAVICTLNNENMALKKIADRQCEMEKENVGLRKRLEIYKGYYKVYIFMYYSTDIQDNF